MRNDWLSRSLAGVILGSALALAVGGIVAWCLPGGIHAPGRTQFVMWSVAPAWMAALGWAFMAKSGVRAWAWLLLANVCAYALFLGARGHA